jgi:hypothetical protein
MNTERKPMQDKINGEKDRILKGLGLAAVNPGAWSGKEWHAAPDADLIDSINRRRARSLRASAARARRTTSA